MDVLQILLLLSLAGIAWFFSDSLKAREAGLDVARRACKADGLQFLDDSVALSRLRLTRDDNGRRCFERTYSFEYSDTGDNRLPGKVRLVGGRVVELDMQLRAALDHPA